jgi:hypothetical protein
MLQAEPSVADIATISTESIWIFSVPWPKMMRSGDIGYDWSRRWAPSATTLSELLQRLVAPKRKR